MIIQANSCNQTTTINMISPLTSIAYKKVTNIVPVRIQYVDRFALGFHFSRSLMVGKYPINVMIQASQYSAVMVEISIVI